MKNRLLSSTLILIALLIAVSCNSSGGKKSGNAKTTDPNKVVLFDGTLDNWVFVLQDSTVNPNTVFTVIDDTIINVKGDPFGYMRTKEDYSNYKLHVEYRYPYELTNSGIFVHCQPGDKVWPVCYENQLSAGNAGDFVLMNGANLAEADQDRIASGAQFVIIRKKAPSAEKEVGQWNTMEIICADDTIETYVNGVFMNRATGAQYSSGKICLQSEGKDIQFKNVYITKL
jgi:hypothetical protein